MNELKLPELGENIDTAEISAVLVAVGDLIREDQPVIEVETEKASLEVPAPFAGRVKELRVKAGDTIKVGQVILVAETVPGEGATASNRDDARPRAVAMPKEVKQVTDETGTAQAVSKKGAGEAPELRRRPEIRDEPPDASDEPAESGGDGSEGSSVVAFPARGTGAKPEIGASVPAAPSVRALARELGVDVNEVPGSGPGGRITRDDVKAHVKSLVRGLGHREAGAAPAVARMELPDFRQWGEVEREPLSKIRRLTAESMSAAWVTVPHVTQFDRADITQLEQLRKRFNQRAEAAERKLTLTAIVVKMAATGLKQFPKLNASLDLARDEVVYKRYVHIGVAVETDRGLMVPVIRDADRLGLMQIAARLNDLAQRARAKKVKPEELRGASFTVSNLGGLGTTYFSPIVHWPEVAILGVGRAEQQAVYEEGQFKPRLILPLSLSYDHRLIDGADAARFQRWLAEALEQPLLLLLEDGP